LSPLLTIQDVLHVPNMSCNLLSVSKLITNKNCQAHFFDTHTSLAAQNLKRYHILQGSQILSILILINVGAYQRLINLLGILHSLNS
jgi:hypothetical protein